MTRTDSKRKGNRVELSLCKLLSDRFGKEFSRTVGSGNRWSQVGAMPLHAAETFSGDIVCPEGFAFSLEVKGGYEIDLSQILSGSCPRLHVFLRQAEEEAKNGREPLLCWKRDRRPWMAAIQGASIFTHSDKEVYREACRLFRYHATYKDWILVDLELLLATFRDSFWFNNTEREV